MCYVYSQHFMHHKNRNILEQLTMLTNINYTLKTNSLFSVYFVSVKCAAILLFSRLSFLYNLLGSVINSQNHVLFHMSTYVCIVCL